MKVKIPIQRLAAEVDRVGEDRTVDVVFYSGEKVRRLGWDGAYMLQFSMDPAAAKLGRLNGGAPVLNAHSQWDVQGVIGVVERAWLDNGRGRATIRFSEREDVAPIWNDVQAKVLRNVSMGVSILQMKELDKEPGGERSFLATEWEPQEISLVPISADAGAKIQLAAGAESDCEVEFLRATPAKGERMDPKEEKEVKAPGALPEAEKVDLAAAGEAARVQERQRFDDITAAVKLSGLEASLAGDYFGAGNSVDEVRTALLQKLAERDRSVETRGQRSEVVLDAADTRREGMTHALLHRYNPTQHKLDKGGAFVGMSLLRMAEECLVASGQSVRGKRPMEIAQLAFHGTTDFPNVLAATGYKTLRDGYEAEPQNFEPFCRRMTVPNFNTFNALVLAEAFDFEKVNPSGEFKQGPLAESKETYKVLTYGKIVAVNRQAIVNDDLNAFTRIPEMHGRAARRLELDTVWGIITANAAMGDGVALFHATHANLAASGAAPSVTTLGAGRKAVRIQKGVGAKARLNLRAAFLILPATLETTGDQLRTQITPAQFSNAVPEWIRGLVPIVEPRLDDNSTTAWYLAADPGQIDTIWYCYLQGQEGVFLDSRIGFEVDGIELKARLDFGAAAIDFRGLYKDPGV